MKPRNIAALAIVIIVIIAVIFVNRTFARQLDFVLLHTREVIRNQTHIACPYYSMALLFDPHTLVSVTRSPIVMNVEEKKRNKINNSENVISRFIERTLL